MVVPTKDQTEIFELLRTKQYMKLWNISKYFGYKIIPDIHKRFEIFCDEVANFDYTTNNNFIGWFTRRLRYYKLNTDYNNSDLICGTADLGRLRQKQKISPDPDEYIGRKTVTEKLKFQIGNKGGI